jgi:hypothetical protein
MILPELQAKSRNLDGFMNVYCQGQSLLII